MSVDLSMMPTPCAIIDVRRLEANIDDLASIFRAAGVQLRPHIKTSKCLEVVRRQKEAGASGFTCSTPAEVVRLAEAGFGDLLWAHLPVGAQKVDFAVHAAAAWKVMTIVDSLAVARPLAEEAQRRGVTVPVLVEIDSGHHRTGAAPSDAVRLGVEVAGLPGLQLQGILTHEGHLSTYAADRDALEAAGRAVAATMAAVARSLHESGVACEVVSVGSTPGITSVPFGPSITEGRPGSYVFFDANQVRLGSASLEQCALNILARVVSARRPGTVIIDAGLKAMSADTLTVENGAGIVCDVRGVPIPDIAFPTANEEHGFLTGPGTSKLEVGDLVRIIPNHACGTVNMWSSLHAVDAESVSVWPVTARH